MSDYLDWEDLVDDEDESLTPQEDRPALDDLLNREDIPDELKELLKTRQELEDQLKSFSLGQNNEPEQDARDKKRFPVKTHTVESRLEEKRQKKIDERKRTAEIRYRERLAKQRKDAEKRFENIEMNKREELTRRKVSEAQAHENERRRYVWRRDTEVQRQQQENWLVERRMQQQINIIADKRQREIEEAAVIKRREISVKKRLSHVRDVKFWEQRTTERLNAATQSIVQKKVHQRRVEQQEEIDDERCHDRLAQQVARVRKDQITELERQLEIRSEQVQCRQNKQRQARMELDVRDRLRLERANERIADRLLDQSDKKNKEKLERRDQEKQAEKLAIQRQEKQTELRNERLKESMKEKIAEKEQERRAEERRLNRNTGTSNRYE